MAEAKDDEVPMEATFSDCLPEPEDILGGRPEAEPPHSSVLKHMLKNLLPGQDLTRVLIPSFFLEPRSLLEKMTDLLMHPDLFVE